ncbi:NodT family efflux transporter outer membrane factor (OMF) lipoprotein [Pseudomonas sp. BIGb0408]|uniref:NodT family efflux transporter outer membrane factor (OMF) lipoprotein n=1 Tax=Phytopseudomonas flavescens TaxID=29435 RepID=A0A7Z0BT32_9GAMM|nr:MULTISPECIES: efflux transporter outer membrane subunit [Pseudomonas]MCW2294863.1 NodT family efflux transporter outer membrane factor (OMF) lipoprotein [Pseudomonas sp. BIGb0408]NYH75863.1 NodT family efflux transporter outer membrane factor (OMF) lipoprotein [Pseudomonas flavescens]
MTPYLISGLLAALLLGGCTQTADAPADLPAAPEHWRNAAAGSTPAPSNQWWRAFASSELDDLMVRALRDNQNLAAAMARLRQAAASARRAGAELSPRLDGNLAADRQARLGGNAHVDGNAYSGNLAASYEVDLWGRLRASRDRAAFARDASQFDRDALQVSLSAAVASAWLDTVGLQERQRIARLNLENAERVLGTVEARQSAGAATSLELAQQRGVVALQRRELAAVTQQREDGLATLAVLLGGRVDQLPASQARLFELPAPDIGAGIPSELLLARPDLARAEANLAAADANLQAARAALLPRLSLRATLGGSADSASRLFANPLYSLGAALSAPIFDAGSLRADRDLAMAQREELLAAYRGALINAFAEVEVALNGLSGSAAQQQAQDEVLRQAERAFRLAESRYRAGAETLLTLLDTQRSLYSAQDEAARLRMLQLQASVNLARALGGGWREETAESSGAAPSHDGGQ